MTPRQRQVMSHYPGPQEKLSKAVQSMTKGRERSKGGSNTPRLVMPLPFPATTLPAGGTAKLMSYIVQDCCLPPSKLQAEPTDLSPINQSNAAHVTSDTEENILTPPETASSHVTLSFDIRK